MSPLCRAFVFVTCLLLAGVAPPVVSGQASVETTRVRQEMSGVFPNDCTGDLTWSLVFHQVGVTRIDGRSGVHFVGRFNISEFQALDPVGNEYTGGYSGQYSFSVNCGEAACEYPVQYTFVSTMAIAGQGSAPNLRIRNRGHIVINASGTIAVDWGLEDVACSAD